MDKRARTKEFDSWTTIVVSLSENPIIGMPIEFAMKVVERWMFIFMSISIF